DLSCGKRLISHKSGWVIEGATQSKNNSNEEISEIEQLNDGTSHGLLVIIGDLLLKTVEKEEYDIPQHLDLLNKWTIPKIPPRIIYQMGTFEKLGLKQVVKTTEETITIDSDHQTFRLLSKNDLAPYRDIYRFMHIGLTSLQDENSLSSLMLNVKLHGYDYIPGTEVKLILVNPRLLPEDLSSGKRLISHNSGFSNPNSIDNQSMSSRITRSNSSYISPVDYIVQVPSRASTSQIRENYRCDNIKIDKNNITRPVSDLDITESEMNFPKG
ncbi:hypothetical protein H5410_026772, partial [Solanum commersonii]